MRQWLAERECFLSSCRPPPPPPLVHWDVSKSRPLRRVLPCGSGRLPIPCSSRRLCSLCMKHKRDQRNHAGTWTCKCCSCIHKDVIDRHSKSVMHREAIKKETLHRQSSHDGGIARAFKRQLMAQKKAMVGAMKVLYWLAKEKVAHTTNYESLLDLAINLGCNYLKELHLADNTSYRSRQIVREFLQTLSVEIKDDVLQDLASSS